MILSEKCLNLYREQYPDDYCGFQMPTGMFMIESEDTCYIQPETETDETFMDRIDRSRNQGRNLFYEEWETFEYDDDTEY